MSFYARESTQFLERERKGVAWEECACLLCGSSHFSPLVEAPDRAGTLRFMVVQCHQCGLCFTNPRPSVSGMSAFYPSDYKPHKEAQANSGRARWWHRLPLVARRAERLRKRLPIEGRGRLLDFGCGSGSFLLRMRGQGWNVTGLDTSEMVIERLRARFGLHVFSGSLPHPALEEESFDVVTMWQTLEHVHQPLEVLQAAHELLSPGGRLIISVPNIDSMAFRWFGSAWNGLDLPRHLVHFTPKTLRRMLERAGFDVGRTCMIRRSAWLRSSARFARCDLAGKARFLGWLRNRFVSNLAGWYGYLAGQADCLLISAEKASA